MRQTLFILLSFMITAVYAQTNLVENPTFKQTEKKAVKETKQIAYAAPWTSPTLESADLYVTKTKSGMVGVPENQYGEEKPMVGDSYAGIVAYSYKSKIPRTYLQGKLTEKLEAGKEYCVTFHVSLADLSKYAVNHLGIALTDKELKENNSDVLQFDNAIESKRLTVYEQQFYWVPVCGKYKAKGGEEYVVIGNFTPEEKLTLNKIKRPRGFTKPQTYDAYYYIDNVSVVPSEEVDKCDCDVIPGMENAQTVERDFTSDKDVNTKTLKIINTDGTEAGMDGQDGGTKAAFSDKNIDGMTISFNPKSFDLSADEVKKLDMVVAYMKENIDEKVVATGFIDPSESDVDKLDGKRVSSVYKYILSKGIEKERVEREMGGKEGADAKDKLKNMRVLIKTQSAE
ncbi:MAG: hypothetical protein KDD41_04060 [Flavobacteriales bacterium]|nr:hypothetical protein [Flavobacteriales bacterium]